MTESVTDIIVARAHRPEQLTRMVVGSALAHAGVLVLVVLVASLGEREQPLRAVMEISLGGGAPGPDSGGLTQMGGRAVQEVAPPEPVKPEAPPMPAPPKMALPEPKTQTKPAARKTPEAAARTPSTGDEIREGSTPVETRARGTGFGLSSAGGAGGDDVKLDVVDFCCQEYFEQMKNFIQSNWVRQQGRTGSTVVRFTIQRDGTIEGEIVETPSGSPLLDTAALRAVQLTTLPSLPAQYPNPNLTVHMRFRY